jgi:hypothetical protein
MEKSWRSNPVPEVRAVEKTIAETPCTCKAVVERIQIQSYTFFARQDFQPWHYDIVVP